jgi:Cof subfamily protein (haloacid dehalogenase superfamily)
MKESDIYKMLCLDVDGTLLDSTLKIPAENKKMIRALAMEGTPVVLVSARPPAGMAALVRELEIDHFPLIAFGGGYITNNRKVIMRKIIPCLDALKVLETTQQWGCDHITAFNGNHWAVRGTDPITEFETDLLGIHPDSVGNLKWVLQHSFKEGVDKFLIGGEHEHLSGLKRKLDGLELPIEAVFSKPHYLEIYPGGISKAGAVSRVTEILGISQKKVIACGDNFNDLAMIDWAGMGVAMGNAPHEVRKKADFITLTNDECGVAHIIRRFFIDGGRIGTLLAAKEATA